MDKEIKEITIENLAQTESVIADIKANFEKKKQNNIL